MKVTFMQTRVVDSKEENLRNVLSLADKSVPDKVDFLVLPEMFNCPYEADKFRGNAEEIPGDTTEFLSDMAKELEAYVIGGSIPERADGSIYNTSPAFGPDGKLIGAHRKVHLFEVDYPGKIEFKESDYLTAGDSETVIDTKFASIGLAVCYDLRFPELLRRMTLNGSRIIFIPAAFNTTTGPPHWKPLLRARAIDNQVFVVACSPARNPDSSYHAYGHSLVVDPWGKVVAEAGKSEEVLTVDIDLRAVEETRRRLPLLETRRPDVY